MPLALNDDDGLRAAILGAAGSRRTVQPQPATIEPVSEDVSTEGNHTGQAPKVAQRPVQPRRDPLATARGLKAATISALLKTTNSKGTNP